MKQLGKVLNKTSWAQASNTINTNSESVFSAVTMLENAAFKQKGYFLTSEELEQLHPSAEEGSQAFVYNPSNPSTAPYDIYQMVGGTWADTGLNGGSVNVNLEAKQDTLVGYSEAVSNGKATQVAIQGDAIALSGKVSLGNVDDIESAILMSSSQAGAAIAKANTLEQSINALKAPVKPIHLNSQGKLELNLGSGLYVEDGKLCTTGTTSGGTGGGEGGKTYSEGHGIIITDNTINVNYDADTMCLNSCGGLAVNYGTGLTMSNNKLVVNPDDIIDPEGGLRIKNTGLAVNVGRGLKMQSCQVVVDPYYLMEPTGGLATKNNLLVVNVGDGLKINSCQVVVDYGTGLSVNSNKIYVDTSKIAGVGVDIDSDHKKLTIGTKAAQELAGDGLAASGSKMKVKYGSGLTTNSCGALIADVANLMVRKASCADVANSITINAGDLSHGGGSYAWYNVYHSIPYTRGDAIILSLRHSYYHLQTDSITVAINVGYGKATITQLNATTGGGVYDKIRVRWLDNQKVYVDVRISSNGVNSDTHYVQGIGSGTFTHPTPTSDDTGTICELSIHQGGVYAPKVWADTFEGNLTGTADKAGIMNTVTAASQDECVPEEFDTMRIYRIRGINVTTTGGDDGWILAFRWAHGNYLTQIYIDVDATHIMSVRHRRLDSTWTEWRQVAFVDQTIAGVTEGLVLNSDRVLSLPNLTSSVTNGAVDGSKNGAQRVLELSCGSIQIKLATGLAIDDNGYLYVQDKYVTK